MKRRDAIAVGGVVALIYGLRALPWNSLFGRGPRFEAMADLPPFRKMSGRGQTSAASAALVGLDPSQDGAAQRRARAEAVRGNICAALFGADAPTGPVPIAYFSEFRCPFCRATEADLEKLLAANPAAFRLVQHELPIFGPPSELAARASVAAARQGRQQELRRRFMRTPLVAEPESVQRVAAGLGLDVPRLIRDMASASVQQELDQTRALADVLGFVGTPGLVIGHTVLNGYIPYAMLARIAKEEQSMPPVVC